MSVVWSLRLQFLLNLSSLNGLRAYKGCFHMVVRSLRRLCSEEGFLRCSARDRATVGGSVHRHAGNCLTLALFPGAA